jgi:NADH:ubiquinone oxidoreductase subunit E
MEGKTDLQICLGSSCFSRGNKKLVKVVEEYIKANNLEHRVYFHGGHCFSKCEHGPTILANGKFYHNLTEESVKELLFNLFGK